MPKQIIIKIRKKYVLFQFLSSPFSPPSLAETSHKVNPCGHLGKCQVSGTKAWSRGWLLVHGELKAVSIITHQAVQSPEMGTENP